MTSTKSHTSHAPAAGTADGRRGSLTYSSTTINLAARNCPRALDYSAARVPYDRDVFQSGITAHAILQAVANYRAAHPDDEPPIVEIAERQMQELLGKGRTFRGHTEPAPPIDAAWAGHEIATAYLRENVPPVGLPEVEVRGEVGPYKVAAILDLVSSAYDFDSGDTLLVVTDYKSSWAADADELDTIQRKIQAVLAWENRGELAARLGTDPETGFEFDGIRLEVVNLRTGAHYSRELREPVLGEYLDEWRRHIEVTIRGLEDAKVECCLCCYSCERPSTLCECADSPAYFAYGTPPKSWDAARLEAAAERRGECPSCHGLGYTRRANPGPRCMGCPYVLACEDARTYLLGTNLGHDTDAAEIAQVYSILSAARDEYAKLLRHATKEQPIKVPGGEVGYRKTSRTVSKPGYAETVTKKWTERGGDTVGLLEAAAVTGYGLKKIAQTLWPGRDKESIGRRARWLATVTEAKAGKEFGSWKSTA